jgi:enolase
MKDLKLEARKISDSRGRPTVQVKAILGGKEGLGDVPAGASKGEDEAATVDVDLAVKNVHEVILPFLNQSNWDLKKHADLIKAEEALVDMAGENFKKLGANAMVPTSRALWQLAARLHNLELWSYIRKFEPEVASSGQVFFYMNIFNGGLHALKKKEGEVLGKDRIDIQEIMIVPVGAKTYKDALEWGEKIDQVLKKTLIAKYGAAAVTRADEAGFSVKGLGDSKEAFARVFDAIKQAGFEPGKQVKMALDVAASSFYDAKAGTYQVQGKSLSSDDMRAYLSGLVDKYPGMMLSVEDGLAENDWGGWTKHTADMQKRNVVTIGDDLFVTQMPRLEKGIKLKAATAILIKVNQNGSMSGTIHVIKHAKASNMKWVVSHRSGETLDDSIADLALATGAMGLKTGDPQPVVDFPDKASWVRRAKYLRMVTIEKQR